MKEFVMDGINLADAKARLSELVDRARSGETVEILRRGKAAARLAPPTEPRKRVDAKALEQLTERLPRQKQSAARMVRAMRDDDRF